MVLETLRQIDTEEMKAREVSELVDIWRKNHQKIREYFQQVELPFFGLHGTTKMGLEGILHDRRCNLNLVTFYDKNFDGFMLLQLYSMCVYAANYTVKGEGIENEGGVMVYDLEGPKGNVTYRWENLFGGMNSQTLTIDSPSEREMFRALQDISNLLYRTDFQFTRDQFDARYKGVYVPSRKFDSILGAGNSMAHFIVAERLCAQYDLAKAIDILSRPTSV